MTIESSTLNNWTRTILSVVVIITVQAVLGALFAVDIPDANRDAVMLVLGALLLRMSDVFTYHFNTTASSAIKDQTIKRQADTTQAAQAALPVVEGSTPPIEISPGEVKTVVGTEE